MNTNTQPDCYDQCVELFGLAKGLETIFDAFVEKNVDNMDKRHAMNAIFPKLTEGLEQLLLDIEKIEELPMRKSGCNEGN